MIVSKVKLKVPFMRGTEVGLLTMEFLFCRIFNSKSSSIDASNSSYGWLERSMLGFSHLMWCGSETKQPISSLASASPFNHKYQCNIFSLFVILLWSRDKFF